MATLDISADINKWMIYFSTGRNLVFLLAFVPHYKTIVLALHVFPILQVHVLSGLFCFITFSGEVIGKLCCDMCCSLHVCSV